MTTLMKIASSASLLLFSLGCASDSERLAEDTDRDSGSTWWQLHDDSELSAELDPWPPQDGTATLRVDASLGDWSDDVLTERVSYRIAEIEDGFDPWIPMTVVGESSEERRFEAQVTLPPGLRYVQLKIEGSAYDTPLELPDWTVTVE